MLTSLRTETTLVGVNVERVTAAPAGSLVVEVTTAPALSYSVYNLPEKQRWRQSSTFRLLVTLLPLMAF
ncbi:MAG: hypothetical protein WKF37_16865 [Bryobacteraceae bacterium]